ncbi:MAG TPA: glycosyltransferase family A protein [Nitrospiraceae bacterium]|jgi:glycosyltransferase involved in cell wall biosynthesis
MQQPLITVIIPAYNCGSIIRCAIESVLDQTYGNRELIVVDDGSTDGTPEVVRDYKDRLTYVRQENGGVSRARNTGIRKSNGEYIAFLDADDVWEKDKLEIQMHFFGKHPEVNLIFTDFKQTRNRETLPRRTYEDAFNIFKEYGFRKEAVFENRSSDILGGREIPFHWGDVYKYLFLGNFILPSSVIFRKESLRDVGLLNEGYRVAEETEFFLRYSHRNQVGFVGFPLLSYALPEPGNLSGKKNTDRLMKNALRTQIDSFLANFETTHREPSFFFKGIGTTYCRLAYYHLSEFRRFESRKYALCSIRTFPRNTRPYLLFLSSFIPKTVLEFLANVKQLRTMSRGA